MGGFGKGSSNMAITGFGDSTPANGTATGVFTGNKTQVGHQLLCRFKSGQVTQFGNRCDSQRAGRLHEGPGVRSPAVPETSLVAVPGPGE